MKTKIFSAACSASMIAAALSMVTTSRAQNYPVKPIRYIVAFPAGGTTDIKGGAFAMTDLIGGQIELSFENAPNCVPHVQSGRLRAIGVTTLTRAQALPDTPPIADAVPGFEVGSWQGLFVPAGVPPAIVSKLNTEVRRILALDDVRSRIVGLGAEVATNTPEQFVEFIKVEMTKWEKVSRRRGRGWIDEHA